MNRALVFWGVTVALLACSNRERTGSLGSVQIEQPATAATPAVFDSTGTLSGPGAPERFSCSEDSDCVVTEIPMNRQPAPPPHLLGCCPTSGFMPMNRAYFDWMRSFQQQHCPADRSACPALPPPAMPNPCVSEARCVEARCSNACEG